MARTNLANKNAEKTHEGAPAWCHMTPMQAFITTTSPPAVACARADGTR